MAAFRAELQKAHRRHDLALCLLIPGIVVLWVGGLAPADPEELANGYSALLYSLPVIEAILMPVMMAVLASRLWDMEIKGNTAKLLYTAEPPQPVCRQGGLWGAGGAVGHGAGAGLRSGAGARSWLYRSLSHRAAGLPIHLHAGGGRNALLWRISADAVGGQPPAGALRGHRRGTGGAVFCFYAACLSVTLCLLGTTSL